MTIKKKNLTTLIQNIRNFSREANFLSLTGNVSISLFGFAGFALLARTYSPEIFGQWVLLIAGAAFIDMFRFGIVNTAVIRYLSGSDETERKKLIGSFILIILLTTVFLATVTWSCYFLFKEQVTAAGYGLFFEWYPFIAFVTIPMNTATLIFQADLRFDRMLLVNTLNSSIFFFVVFLNYFFLNWELPTLVLAQFLVSVLVSLFCIAKGWDGTKYIFKATRESNKKLIDFGKYTTLTLIGTNLLRSADTFIISLSPFGTTAVALYAIPMKLTELQQIPLRSFAATAFPKMSKESMLGNSREVKRIFYTYSGAMTYLFAAISLITFIFAEQFVHLFGGAQYLLPDPVSGAHAVDIVRIFSIYGLLLPVERMTGVGLDSINKPAKNFQKVLYMVAANITGDLLAVFVFKSLEAVAVASVIFTLLGVWIGFSFLNKHLGVNQRRIFTHGIVFYKNMYHKVKNAASVS